MKALDPSLMRMMKMNMVVTQILVKKMLITNPRKENLILHQSEELFSTLVLMQLALKMNLGKKHTTEKKFYLKLSMFLNGSK